MAQTKMTNDPQTAFGDGPTDTHAADQGASQEEEIDVWIQFLAHMPKEDRQNCGLPFELRKADLEAERGSFQSAEKGYRQVLEICTPENAPGKWAVAQNNLGLLYLDWVTGDPAKYVELAINCFRQALTVRKRKTAPESWAETTHNLANAYKVRVQGNRAKNLDKAIKLYKEALEVRTRQEHPIEWAATVDDLGSAYMDRIVGDRAENLEQAIKLLQSAMEVRTKEHLPEQWAITSNKLGSAHLFRIRGDRNENLKKSLGLLTPVLDVWTRKSNPIGYAETSIHLGNVYYKMTHGGRRDHLEDAIVHYKNASEAVIRDENPILWAKARVCLGNAYQQRIEGIRAENLEESIWYFESALTGLTEPFQHAYALNNLANSLRMRSCGLAGPDLSRARALYHKALQVLSLEAVPADHLQTQSASGRMEFGIEDWERAHNAFSAALDARNRLYTAGATTEARQHAIEEAAEIPAMDAYCLARLDRGEEAVEVLERARARALRETLARNEAALGEASDEHRNTFLAVSFRIANLEAEARAEDVQEPGRRGFVEISHDLGTAREDLARISEQIRAYVPGFMPAESSFPEIAEAASFSGFPIVYLATVDKGSLALVVPPAGAPKIFWLPAFSRANLDALLFDPNEPRYLIGAVLDNPDALMRSLDAAWSVMGQKLLAPLAQQLAGQGWARAALIAVGLLDLLPLSSMAPPEVLFTSVPSARALSTACRSLRQRSGTEPVFLGIGDPQPSSEDPLPSAADEAKGIAQIFPPAGRHLLLKRRATHQEVTTAIPGATHLHFACHGRFDPVTPLDSALVLSGEDRLTLREILDGKLDLSATRIAVLSACQTGIKDYRSVPDEVVGFPSALLQAGVPGVLSTLWPVSDAAARLLLQRFYELHLKEHLDAAEALRRAQQWLSAATPIELGAVDWEVGSRFLSNPLAKPYAHPVYWASFVFTGAFG